MSDTAKRAKDIGPELLNDPDADGAAAQFSSVFVEWESFVGNNVWKSAINNEELFSQLVDWTILAVDLSHAAGLDTPTLDDLETPQEFVNVAQAVIGSMVRYGRKVRHSRNVRSSIENAQAVFAGMKGDSPKYTFSDDQLQEVQRTINQLRDQIIKLESIPDQHRRRLLGRLEALQREMHQEMASLDRYMGTLMDVAVWAKRIEAEASPLLDKVERLFYLALAAGAAAANLPQGELPLALPPAMSSRIETLPDNAE